MHLSDCVLGCSTQIEQLVLGDQQRRSEYFPVIPELGDVEPRFGDLDNWVVEERTARTAEYWRHSGSAFEASLVASRAALHLCSAERLGHSVNDPPPKKLPTVSHNSDMPGLDPLTVGNARVERVSESKYVVVAVVSMELPLAIF